MTRAGAAAVLIVEDELLVASDLQHSLTDMGYDAFAVAASGDEALAHAALRQPDVVLMDIRIKGLEDGIRTAERLKQHHPVIVIYLTAYADDAMIDRAKRTEPDGYLVKPVKEAELYSMIEISLYRRQTQAERQRRLASEHRLFAITENVPVAIAYFDRKGKVEFANHVFRELVPFNEDPTGVSAMAFLGEELYRRSYAPRQQAMLGERVQFVLELPHQGQVRKIEVTCLPDADRTGNVLGVYAIGYDVTERETLSAELRQTHVDLETILNAVPAQIASWRRELTVRFANTAARSQFTVQPAATTAVHLRELLGGRLFEQAQPFVSAALAGQSVSFDQIDPSEQGTRYRKLHIIPEKRGAEVVGLYTLAFDVTELREAHERVRQLTQRLEDVREEERRTVATVLHDGIAQDLFAVKLGIDNLLSRSKRQKTIQALCKEVLGLVHACMQDVRLIANQLRPIALKYFGVATVIAEHARHFGQRSRLDIRVCEESELPELEESVSLLLFRAAQEALTNVARHARASRVEVILRSVDSNVTLEVADDGVGLAPSCLQKPLSLGLLALRERAEALGGSLALEPRPSGGTRFLLNIPARG